MSQSQLAGTVISVNYNYAPAWWRTQVTLLQGQSKKFYAFAWNIFVFKTPLRMPLFSIPQHGTKLTLQ
jgi:hypothetical protein